VSRTEQQQRTEPGQPSNASDTDKSDGGKPRKPTKGDNKPHKPTEVDKQLSFFDRFAQRAADFASRAPFFAICVLILLVWGPSYFVLKNLDTWQLIINTATTIITFLMVALLQNTQTRNDKATQHKLNAVADALADLMEHVGGNDPEVKQDIKELIAAVGLEDRESTS
jgi:low affinity Fe/Cu permease